MNITEIILIGFAGSIVLFLLRFVIIIFSMIANLFIQAILSLYERVFKKS